MLFVFNKCWNTKKKNLKETIKRSKLKEEVLVQNNGKSSKNIFSVKNNDDEYYCINSSKFSQAII